MTNLIHTSLIGMTVSQRWIAKRIEECGIHYAVSFGLNLALCWSLSKNRLRNPSTAIENWLVKYSGNGKFIRSARGCEKITGSYNWIWVHKQIAFKRLKGATQTKPVIGGFLCQL